MCPVESVCFCVLPWVLPGTKQCFLHSRSLISASSLAGHCTDNYPRKALLQKLSKDTQYDNAVHYHTLEYSIPKSPGRDHGVSSAPLISCNSGCTKDRVSGQCLWCSSELFLLPSFPAPSAHQTPDSSAELPVCALEPPGSFCMFSWFLPLTPASKCGLPTLVSRRKLAGQPTSPEGRGIRRA